MMAYKIGTLNSGRIITSYPGWELQASSQVGVQYFIDWIQPIDQIDDVCKMVDQIDHVRS